jgi:hypothetical protein
LKLIRSRIVVVGQVPEGPVRRVLKSVLELTIRFGDPRYLGEERKILLDVGSLFELSQRAQERRSRNYSTSTVAAGVKVGAAVESIVRRWLGRR